MKKINLIVLSDLQHSSPRITNLVHYIDNSRFKKYIIGANHKEYLIDQDFPEDFFNYVEYLSFNRKFNLFQFLKKNVQEVQTTADQKKTGFILLKKFFLKISLSFLFPDQYLYSINSYLKRAKSLIPKLEGKIIILTSHPYPISHLAGYFIKKKYKDRVLWIADYRDLWTLNHNYSFNRLRQLADEKFEKYIMKKADLITTVSDFCAETQSKFLKRKINIIYNGYSIYNYKSSKLDFYDSKFLSKKKKYILHVGSLYFDFMNVDLLFSSLNDISDNDFEIHFIGNFSAELEKKIYENNLSNKIRQLGKFSRYESIEIQKKYDFLLIFDYENNRGESYQDSTGVLPLKFFEYIQSTKPILCLGGRYNSDVKKILSDLNRGVILRNKNQAGKFFSSLGNTKLDIRLDKSENYKYSYKNSAKDFEALIYSNLGLKKNNSL